MTRSREADVARLYHAHSSHVAARPLETGFDDGAQVARFRSLPGAPRTALSGRDFALDMTLGEALARRRSLRDHELRPLPLETLGRLLHVSYGVRGRRQGGYDRPTPSAGGLYPCELYVAAQAVEGLPDGIHHYDARAHDLALIREGAAQEELVALTLGQEMIRAANLVFIVTAVRARTMFKYGQRGYRFLFLDAGHLGQSLYLAATALGLGPAGVGGFLDAELNALLSLPEGEEALYLVVVGQPR